MTILTCQISFFDSNLHAVYIMVRNREYKVCSEWVTGSVMPKVTVKERKIKVNKIGIR